jgi:hypothetical protein
MITRRRIICSILSAFFIVSCSVFESGTAQRVVRVKALADAAFKARNSRWADEARGLIEAASDYYEREFGIRFITESVSAWPENERVPSTPTLLARLQKEFPVRSQDRSYDVIVAFTGESVNRILTAGRPRVDRIGNCNQGLGNYVVVPISKIFQYRGPNAEVEIDLIALIHEFGHIFGAEHVEDPHSIMHEQFGFRTEFDAKNRAVIQKNRTCPFAK